MIFLIIFAIFALCTEISMSANLYDQIFYKTKGPYFVSNESVNWTDARIGCKNADLELASIISEEEQMALKTFLSENNLVPEDKWSGYWLSGVRQDGKYYWDSTGTEVDSSFRGWAWGEPSHAYGREDCMELKWDEIRLGWNDYFCDESRKFICQVSRKLKPKSVKKKLLKPFFQKEWQYKESVNDSLIEPKTKETEVNEENVDDLKIHLDTFEDVINYYYTTPESSQFDYPTEPKRIS